MAIKRTAAQTVQTSPEVVDAHTPDNTAPTGPVGVPDVASGASTGAPTTNPSTSTSPRRGRPPGYKQGPRLAWGQVVGGDAKLLQRTVVDVAREVSQKYNGRATLQDVVEGLKSHPVFTDNQSADGIALSDLVTITNVRNKWHELKTNYCIGWAMKRVDEGGLGLTGSADEVADQLTDDQWNQMEDAISQPKPQGLNFPKLIIVRGRKGQTLDMSDI